MNPDPTSCLGQVLLFSLKKPNKYIIILNQENRAQGLLQYEYWYQREITSKGELKSPVGVMGSWSRKFIVKAAPRAVMEDGHPVLIDSFESLHAVCYLFLRLSFSWLFYFILYFPPPFFTLAWPSVPSRPSSSSSSYLELFKAQLWPVEKKMCIHTVITSKRDPRGKNELHSCSPPRLAEPFSILALCIISLSDLAGYFLPQDM